MTPNFILEQEILPNTSLYYPVKNFVISQSPRLLLISTGLNGQNLMLYRHQILSNLEEYKKNNNFESSYVSQILIKHFYYQDN